ncbi:hypothetical protein K438DRAFT_526763 [Mycena galopus ATCC 62051]|nr:hypothetical protein K438DRAFT_526763 [Mycena galopus ATCC 62051]
MDVEQPAAPLFDLICHFPALQDLRLLTMGANWGHPATGASPPQRLRKLALLHEISAPVLSWLHTFHILSNLDSLLLARMQSDDVPAVRTAMQQISSTLRHLTINLDGLHTDGTFDFSRYSNLQTLRIRWWDLRPDQLMIPISTLADLPLKSLALDIDPSKLRSFDWGPFDALLVSPRLPLLRSVTLRCATKDDREFSRGVLPLLEASTSRDLILRIIKRQADLFSPFQWL